MDVGDMIMMGGLIALLLGILAVFVGSNPGNSGGALETIGATLVVCGLAAMIATVLFRPSVKTQEATVEEVEVYWLQELDGGSYLEPLPDGTGWRCLGIAEEGGACIVEVPDVAALTQALGAPRVVLETSRTIERPRLGYEPWPVVEALWPRAVEDARKPDGECEVLAESRSWRVEVPAGGVGEGRGRS